MHTIIVSSSFDCQSPCVEALGAHRHSSPRQWWQSLMAIMSQWRFPHRARSSAEAVSESWMCINILNIYVSKLYQAVQLLITMLIVALHNSLLHFVFITSLFLSIFPYYMAIPHLLISYIWPPSFSLDVLYSIRLRGGL